MELPEVGSYFSGTGPGTGSLLSAGLSWGVRRDGSDLMGFWGQGKSKHLAQHLSPNDAAVP